MQIDTITKHTIILDVKSERFNADDSGRTVRVDRLTVHGADTVWAEGWLLRKDGSVGERRGTNVLLELSDLPFSVITALTEHLLGKDD